MLDETPVEIPPLLLKLAEITDFDLYVSTSFDNLLSRALSQERHGGQALTQVLSYSFHGSPEDLPRTFRGDGPALVFQIFGAASPVPDYAVTDEDMLEFLHRLQEDAYRPSRLFDELYNRNLLLIGCGFPDWVARFFIRTLSRQRLLEMGDTTRFVVDRETKMDTRLMLFLRDWHTEVYPEGNLAEFVNELNRRWSERNTSHSSVPEAPSAVRDVLEPMLPGSIFISYNRDDLPEVQKLHDALERAGIDVWFDVSRLGSGDAWESRIQDNIRNCSLFLAIISRNAVERMEGFYRREWRWGLDRDHNIADLMPFIIPIIIDDTAPGTPGVPDYFWTKQLERAPGGLPSLGVVERLKNALRQHQLHKRGQQ